MLESPQGAGTPTEPVQGKKMSEKAPLTLGDARDRYLERATLKSKHTVAAYQQSIATFLTFLDETQRRGTLPIQRKGGPAEDLQMTDLGENDAPVLLAFAEWLLSDPGDLHDPRPYAPATVRLRLAGVGRWLQWLDDYGWLPAEFPLAKAQRIVRDELRAHQQTRSGAPEPPRVVD